MDARIDRYMLWQVLSAAATKHRERALKNQLAAPRYADICAKVADSLEAVIDHIVSGATSITLDDDRVRSRTDDQR